VHTVKHTDFNVNKDALFLMFRSKTKGSFKGQPVLNCKSGKARTMKGIAEESIFTLAIQSFSANDKKDVQRVFQEESFPRRLALLQNLCT